MIKENKIPKPGSDEAIEKGCICAVLDNAHGKGAWGNPDWFWITQGCPLHDPKGRGDQDKPVSFGFVDK